MPRKKTIPGSVYVQNGRTKLMIKFQGRRIATGLEDTKEGRKIAAQMLERLYLESKGLAPVIEEQPEGVWLDDAFDKFLEVHCSNKTQGTKDNFLAAFKAIARSNYLLNVNDLEADILYYLAHTTHQPYTINNYLVRFQTFLNFCTKRDWLPETTFAKQHEKRVESIVQTWEEWEIERLITYFDERDKEFSVMIQFMLQTGARIVDCLTLEWEQVQGNVIRWRNKITKRSEPRPIGEAAQDLLRQLPRTSAKVFRWQYSSKSRLIRRFNTALEECGIEKKGRGLQEMRVTFRNSLLDSGVQAEVAQYLMRHRDIRTTLQHYTRIEETTAQNALKNIKKGNIRATREKELSSN